MEWGRVRPAQLHTDNDPHAEHAGNTHPMNQKANRQRKPRSRHLSAPEKCPRTGNAGTDPASFNAHAQPHSLERFTRSRGASPKGRNQRATAAQSLTLQRPPASLECAAAAGPLRSSAQRFTGTPLPWPPAPGGSSCFPAQLPSSAEPHGTPLSHVPAGLEQHVQGGS